MTKRKSKATGTVLIDLTINGTLEVDREEYDRLIEETMEMDESLTPEQAEDEAVFTIVESLEGTDIGNEWGAAWVCSVDGQVM